MNTIIPEILELKELNLTKWGQIRLMLFPAEAITACRSSLKYMQSKNPFSHFFDLCSDYCKTNDISLNFSTCKELQTTYQMPVDAPMTLKVEAKDENKMMQHTYMRDEQSHRQYLADIERRFTFEEAIIEITKIEKDALTNPLRNFLGDELFNANIKAQCERLIERVRL